MLNFKIFVSAKGGGVKINDRQLIDKEYEDAESNISFCVLRTVPVARVWSHSGPEMNTRRGVSSLSVLVVVVERKGKYVNWINEFLIIMVIVLAHLVESLTHKIQLQFPFLMDFRFPSSSSLYNPWLSGRFLHTLKQQCRNKSGDNYERSYPSLELNPICVANKNGRFHEGSDNDINCVANLKTSKSKDRVKTVGDLQIDVWLGKICGWKTIREQTFLCLLYWR